jgi:hypothetical protein
MAEFKIFGTQPNQVPTNADLGTAAFNDANDFLHSRSPKLAEIQAYLYSQQNLDDIRKAFIYDTSLDSDGGAWRKRTHNTSWYNEDLNTHFRGKRREFPSVAIIIMEDERIVIYDGDDPEFPMWMIIPEYTNDPVYSFTTNALSHITALNGKLGIAATFYRYFDFIEDMAYLYDNAAKYTFNGKRLADRNYYSDNGRTPTYSYVKGIGALGSGGVCRSITYRVFPGAKVDPATGLPMPTALITGNNGFSLIKNHGSDHEGEEMHDVTNTSGTVPVHWGDLDPEKPYPNSYVGWYSGGYGQVRRYINVSGEQAATHPWSNVNGVDFSMDYDSQNSRTLTNDAYQYKIGVHPFASQGAFSMNSAWFPTSVTALPDDTVVVGSGKNGLNLLHKPTEPRGDWNYLTAYINTKYNTGWMPGAITLATLADTNTGAWYSANLLGNPTFADTSVWSAYNSSFTVSGNVATITPTSTLAGIQQSVSGLIPGRQYYMQATVNTAGNRSVRAQISGIGLRDEGISSQSGVKVLQASFTASSTTHTLEILAYSAIVNETFTISNTIFKECVADRSPKMNGVQVVGDRVERNKVGSGADLVAYGPFSGTSYLQQSYNPDLNWNGSSDFTVVFWWNPRIDNAYDTLMERGYHSGGAYSGARWMIQSGSQNTTSFKINGNTVIGTNSGGFENWQCICYSRVNGVLTSYRNGVKESTATDTTDLTNTVAYFNIGVGADPSNAPSDSSQLALLRLSNSATDDRMAKKIFDDEKHLFARNAKAVLYQNDGVGEREYGTSQAHNYIYDSDYDPVTGLHHHVNASGRSTFNILTRVDNSVAQHSQSIDQRNSTVAARDNLIVEE